MDLIYRLLKNLRYLFKDRNIKKIFTIAIIIMLLSMVYSCVFATDVTVKNNTFTMGSYFDDKYFIAYESNNYYYPYGCVVGTDIFTMTEDTNKFVAYCENGYVNYNNGASGNVYTTSDGNGIYVLYTNTKDVYDFSVNKIAFSNFDVYDSNGTLLHKSDMKKTYQYTVELSTEQTTTEPLIVYTNWFDNSDFGDFAIHIVQDYDTEEALNIEMSYEVDENTNQFRYYHTITRNGNYMLVFRRGSGGNLDIQTIEFTVSNIVILPDNPTEPTTSDYTENFNNMENAISGTTQAVENLGNTINGTTQAVENLGNTINGTTQAINETNSFLTDNTVDDTNINLPTVEVNDPTANFFDTMFTGLYNAVTSNEDKTITLTMFGNNIQVSSSDFNYLQANEWSILRVILSSMWVVGIGTYVLKDIRKMIEKIKDGDVENMASDDIKANMV